ncbi:MAG TPA: rod shape-determining protein MreC, partial [Hydrogenophaga sp.]|nr:rod shape-determining protein MreC [Hydrogenophaga sp.]
MPLGTLDRTPPPFFKQGPSALSKLLVFSATALFLMVADVRFQVTGPVRSAMATVLYPVQWLVMQPIQAAATAGGYLTSLHEAQRTEREALKRLSIQAERSLQVEQLMQENKHLREMLTMRERSQSVATGAQVLYDTADPYSRKVVIDRGQAHGVVAGSPVIDEHGVLGQITRVYPLLSEVTLLIDRDQAIPVINARTSVRGVAFGQPSASGDGLELRYTLASADIEEGDLLTTSGVDGVYPPGLPVAKV